MMKRCIKPKRWRMATPTSDTHLAARYLITTEVKVLRCKACKAYVLSGHCGGLPTVVGLQMVPECEAHAAGLWTYDLRRGRLYLREQWGTVPRVSSEPVLADHRHDD